MEVLLLLLLLGMTQSASGTVFTLRNRCPSTVWPGTLSGNGAAVLGGGGFQLPPNAAVSFPAPSGWSGRFWARTSCTFGPSSAGSCATGDCDGALNCTNGGVPPVTLAEFTLGANGEKDFYDVSLVDGYNVGVGIRPSTAGSGGGCRYAGCVADLNTQCPPELRVVGGSGGGRTVACRSACAAFGSEEYCCTGAHASPATCGPTRYSRLFKEACPTAYSYAYDDATSTCTCAAGSDYIITFCPTTADG